MNEQDITVRLQLTACKCSELTNTFVNNLKYGRKCAQTEWKNLILLNAYISLLEDYDVDSDTNCITEDQLNIMLDNISILTKICFKPEGFNYYSTLPSSQFDSSFDESFN